MSAYFIFTREKTLDAAELEIYFSEIRATLAGHEVKVLASYGPQEVLEGPATEGTVIAEFPSIEAAKAWYDSPAYREVREHRFKGAILPRLISRRRLSARRSSLRLDGEARLPRAA